jgi:hypothetical protein
MQQGNACDVCEDIGAEHLQVCRKDSEGSSRPQYAFFSP